MRRKELQAFLAEQLDDARESGVLFSVHLKATMMKVSDPIIFGHAVGAMFGELFDKRAGINPDDGLAALAAADDEAQAEIDAVLAEGPALYMVDSDRGVTNLHVPSDVIIDASMPALIRSSGTGLGRRGRPAGHQVRDPRQLVRGALPGDDRPLPRARRVRPGDDGHDPQRRPDGPEGRGVRLARQDLRDRGPGHGARGRPARARPLLEHEVDTGDIWRMCQTKDAPIQDWVRLAVSRAQATGAPAVFWLDETRAHDAQLLEKVRPALEELDTDGAADRDPAGGRGHALHARARARGRGHDLGDRATCCATT